MPTLARLTPSLAPAPERRRDARRERHQGPVIPSQHAFAREERLVLRDLERRRERRRDDDVAAVLRETPEGA